MPAAADASSFLTAALADLDRKGLRRALREIASGQGPVLRAAGREFLNFSSNDYLGLAADPRLPAAAAAAGTEWGAGSGASRLVCGSLEIHHRLERRAAEWKREAEALVFASGFAANLGAVPALAGPGDVVWLDRYVHASLVDAARLSGAKLQVYPHLDVEFLRRRIKRSPARRHVVLTDTVFSMDGDCADLAALAALSAETGCFVYADEAHAAGVYGPTGRGLAEEQGVEGRLGAVMATFSKAFGCQGGFVAGPAGLRDLLVNRARSFVYSTGPSPLVSAASLAALDLVQSEPWRRERLWANARRLRARLSELGLDVAGSGPIAPVVIGDTRDTMALAGRLFDRGVLAPGIRPPTVPKGTDRIRLTVSASHTDEHIDRLAAVLKEVL